MEYKGEIVIYQSPDGHAAIDVKLENNTIWLYQKQIADLFGTEVPAINKHIKNILKAGELGAEATISKMEIVRKEGKREVKRTVNHYNLDMIISIGYRVNSIRGTQFRIWANQVLKEYLSKGYVIDQKRMEEQSRQLEELKHTVKLLGNVIAAKDLSSSETSGLLKVITDYTYALS